MLNTVQLCYKGTGLGTEGKVEYTRRKQYSVTSAIEGYRAISVNMCTEMGEEDS